MALSRGYPGASGGSRQERRDEVDSRDERKRWRTLDVGGVGKVRLPRTYRQLRQKLESGRRSNAAVVADLEEALVAAYARRFRSVQRRGLEPALERNRERTRNGCVHRGDLLGDAAQHSTLGLSGDGRRGDRQVPCPMPMPQGGATGLRAAAVHAGAGVDRRSRMAVPDCASRACCICCSPAKELRRALCAGPRPRRSPRASRSSRAPGAALSTVVRTRYGVVVPEAA